MRSSTAAVDVRLDGSRVPWLWRASILGWMIATAALTPNVAAQEIVDRIVAIVDQDVITLSEAEQARRVGWLREDEDRLSLAEAVERLVERSLIERELRRNPDRSADSSLGQLAEGSLARIRNSFVSPSAYRDALDAYRMREVDVLDELRRQHAVNLFLERRFRGLIYVTQEEIAAYYRDELTTEVGTRQELPPIEELAERIERLLQERKFNLRIETWIDGLKSRVSIRRYVW